MSANAELPTSDCAIVVMGVSGSGKTSIGERLATKIGAPFIEGDGLHPLANVQKMSSGVPLTDEDRWPWLHEITRRINDLPERDVVVTCSSLRRSYRDRLRAGVKRQLAFVFLKGSPDLLESRMRARKDHFMPLELLATQLATLEDPSCEPDVVVVDINAPFDEIIALAIEGLHQLRSGRRDIGCALSA